MAAHLFDLEIVGSSILPPATMKTNYNSDYLCEKMAEISKGQVILMFSRGKDSTSAYYQLKKYFKKIHLVYKMRVPGLQFVENSLLYYEEKFGQKIHRIVHPDFFHMINNYTFQTPARAAGIYKIGIPTHTQREYDTLIPVDLGLKDVWIASGVRMADSLIRRHALSKFGVINKKTRFFYPVFDWTNDMVRSCLNKNNITLPIDYELWGRTFDGLKYRFVKHVKERFPEDYEVIKFWFPLIELELKRYGYE